MRNRNAQPGFALLLVMILVSAGVVLGMSYLSVASLKVRVSQNYQQFSRARYLAESGLEHANYVLRMDPQGLADAGQLGPFHADGSSDSYVISCIADASVPGKYTLTSTATVGQVKRTSSMTVYRSSGPELEIKHAVVVGGGLVMLPWGLEVTGDLHTNGFLMNMSLINGDVTSSEGVTDAWGRITGSIDGSAALVDVPNLEVDDYRAYWVDGVEHSAATVETDNFTHDDPLAGGGAITAGNAGGVVILTPRIGSDTVTLHDNLDFTGTLVIEGNVRLDGSNIQLTAVEGFPALIVTGSVQVTNDARNVTINGVVCAEDGIVPAEEDTSGSSTTINGALATGVAGYSSSLSGTHVLNYTSSRTTLRDLSLTDRNTTPSVTVLDWND